MPASARRNGPSIMQAQVGLPRRLNAGLMPWVMPKSVGVRHPPRTRVVALMHAHNARMSSEMDQTELPLYAATARTVDEMGRAAVLFTFDDEPLRR